VLGLRGCPPSVAVSHRTPFHDARFILRTMVPRTECYTCDAKVWDLSIVQGPFSVAPCQTLGLALPIRISFAPLCGRRVWRPRAAPRLRPLLKQPRKSLTTWAFWGADS
jgi:hypothetical protein